MRLSECFADEDGGSEQVERVQNWAKLGNTRGIVDAMFGALH